MHFRTIFTIFAVIAFFISLITIENTTAAEIKRFDNKSIIDLAIEYGHTEKLIDVLKSTGVMDILNSGQDFTVFAPVDEAFSRMSPQEIADLLNNPDELKKVVMYHIAAGENIISEMKCGDKVETLLGKEVKFRITDSGQYQIENANVIKSDLLGYNGVVQIIDKVNLPSEQKFRKMPMKDCE